MESPSTAISTAASALDAGPDSGDPSSSENVLPWQGHGMSPSELRLDEAALVGAHRGEGLEVALGRLGHHDLGGGDHEAAPHGYVAGAGERLAAAGGRTVLARRGGLLIGAGGGGRVGGRRVRVVAARGEQGHAHGDGRGSGQGTTSVDGGHAPGA